MRYSSDRSDPSPTLARRAAARVLLLLLLLTTAGTGALVASGASARAAGASEAAVGQAVFAVQPVKYDPALPATRSYFIFDSTPNAVVQSQVRVTNSGTARGTARLYAVDATTGSTSGLVYRAGSDPRADVGAWLKLATAEVTLAPGQSQVVPFTITVPAAVRPGQHVGGIVAENTDLAPSSGGGDVHISVQNLSIAAVQVNLPGTPVERLVATGIAAGGANGYQSLALALGNTGTMMLKPFGTLEVRDRQGALRQRLTLTLDTLLPQTAIAYPVYIAKQALGAGSYQASLVLTYGHDQILRYSTAFSVTAAQLATTFTGVRHPGSAPEDAGAFSFLGLPTTWGFGGAAPMWQFLFLLLLIVVVLQSMVLRREQLHTHATRAVHAVRSWQRRRSTPHRAGRTTGKLYPGRTTGKLHAQEVRRRARLSARIGAMRAAARRGPHT